MRYWIFYSLGLLACWRAVDLQSPALWPRLLAPMGVLLFTVALLIYWVMRRPLPHQRLDKRRRGGAGRREPSLFDGMDFMPSGRSGSCDSSDGCDGGD